MSVNWPLKRLEIVVVEPFSHALLPSNVAAFLPWGSATELSCKKRRHNCVSWDRVVELFSTFKWKKSCSVFFFLKTNSIVELMQVLQPNLNQIIVDMTNPLPTYQKCNPFKRVEFPGIFVSSKRPLFHMRCHFKWLHFCGWVKMRCRLQAFERPRLWYEKSRGLDQLDVWGKESRPCVCLIGESLIGLFWTAGHDTSHEYCLWPKTNIPLALIAG